MWKSKYNIVSLKTKVDRIVPFTKGKDVIIPKGTSCKLITVEPFSNAVVCFYDSTTMQEMWLQYDVKDLEMRIEIVGESEKIEKRRVYN